jgi:hypothetical protein
MRAMGAGSVEQAPGLFELGRLSACLPGTAFFSAQKFFVYDSDATMRLKTKVAKGLAKVCGAYARSTGKPCQCKLTFRGGRCKLHGGASSGPKTAEGREKALQAMRDGWRRWRQKNGGV